MRLSQDVARFMEHVVTACGLDSSSLFLCDRSRPDRARLVYLHHVGVDAETQYRYQNAGIFAVDPFTHPSLHETRQNAGRTAFMLSCDDRVRDLDTSARDYWGFMKEQGIEVVGAAAHRLRERCYLVAGAHLEHDAPRKRDISPRSLRNNLERLLNLVTGQIVAEALCGNPETPHVMLMHGRQPDDTGDDGTAALSRRELEIARYICEGRQNKEIAHVTRLSEHTVENHLRHIYRKLQIHNRAALVSRMLKQA